MADSLFSAFQQIPNIGSRNGISYATGITQRGLLGAFYEDHIDHSVDKSGFGIIKWTAAVAWIGGAIELEYGVAGLLQLTDHFCIELS